MLIGTVIIVFVIAIESLFAWGEIKSQKMNELKDKLEEKRWATLFKYLGISLDNVDNKTTKQDR